MKKSILILGFSLFGLIGLAQQNNEEKKELLYNHSKFIEENVKDFDINLSVDTDKILVINDVNADSELLNNHHEFTHEAFRISEDHFDYREGVYTLNEYVFNYKLEFFIDKLKI